MPRLVYALLCRDLIVDKASNSTSFIRSVEHAVAREVPATLPPLFVASLWELAGDPAPFSVSLGLKTPAGQAETLGIQEVRPEASLLHKLNFQLPGINVAEHGLHYVEVSLKDGDGWTPVATLPLYVAEPEAE